MKRTFLVFAAGWPGVALVMLRLSLAIFLIYAPVGRMEPSSWPALALYVVAGAVAAGLRTRIAACISFVVAINLVIGTGHFPSLNCFAHALDAMVLTLTGPGAYSIDARLFGRRTVHLQP